MKINHNEDIETIHLGGNLSQVPSTYQMWKIYEEWRNQVKRDSNARTLHITFVRHARAESAAEKRKFVDQCASHMIEMCTAGNVQTQTPHWINVMCVAHTILKIGLHVCKLNQK